MVKEASCSFIINPQFIVPAQSSSMVIKDASKVSGMPKFNGNDVASMADVVRNHRTCGARLDGARLDGVLRESPLIEVEAEELSGQPAGKMGNSASIRVSSSIKTKTEQLSGNSYSEEVEKFDLHGPAFQAEESQHSGLGNEKNLRASSPVPHDSELSAPPGFDIQLLKETGEVSAPPRFEGTKSLK